ncbi:hypothetical protein DNTS_013851 [Danionella cerebrum]|nr:hypothetical protein DNTS_013851 [Danionella translucida]
MNNFIQEEYQGQRPAEDSPNIVYRHPRAVPFISIGLNGRFIPCQHRYETYTSWPRSPIIHCGFQRRDDMYTAYDNQNKATTGGMSQYQNSSPASGLSQDSSSPLSSPQVLMEETSRRKAVRLMKNREAARECRRKKKEYVRCLENRVAVLENQNKTLIEELKALKDLCRHKND